MLHPDKIVIPVGHVAEIHNAAVPMLSLKRKAVKDSLARRFKGHVSDRFNIFTARRVVGSRCNFPAEAAAEVTVAGNCAYTLVNPVFAAKIQRDRMAFDTHEKMGGTEELCRNFPDIQNPMPELMSRKGKVRGLPFGYPGPSAEFVRKRQGMKGAVIPKESPLNASISETERISFTDGIRSSGGRQC